MPAAAPKTNTRNRAACTILRNTTTASADPTSIAAITKKAMDARSIGSDTFPQNPAFVRKTPQARRDMGAATRCCGENGVCRTRPCVDYCQVVLYHQGVHYEGSMVLCFGGQKPGMWPFHLMKVSSCYNQHTCMEKGAF